MDDKSNLRAELKSPDVGLRAAAAEKLCQAGSDASDAAVDLVQACADEEAVSNWAVAALEDLGVPPVSAIGPLQELLSSTNSLAAYWAATLLGRLGLDAQVSERHLAKVLANSKDVAVQERIAWALGKIGVTSDEALKALNSAASGGDTRLAELARSALSASEG